MHPAGALDRGGLEAADALVLDGFGLGPSPRHLPRVRTGILTMEELKAAEKAAVLALRQATERLDLITQAIAVGTHTEAPKRKRGRPAKKAKAEVSRVQQGPTRRGRKEKFDHATQLAMAKAKAGGATFKALASEYKASIPTIMRAISRVNGEAHA